MKCAFIALLVLVFTALSSAHTFLLKVKIGNENKEEYIEYNGHKHYLTDEPGKTKLIFLDSNCVVNLDVTKSDPAEYRPGSAVCKSSFPDFAQQHWDHYVKERLGGQN